MATATVRARVDRRAWGDPGQDVAAGTRPWALYGSEQEPLAPVRPAIVLPSLEPGADGAPADIIVPIPPTGGLTLPSAYDFEVAEAVPATALPQLLRRRAAERDEPEPHDDDVPMRSFMDDLDRKVALRRVMGRPDDDDEAREQEEPESGDQFTKEEVNYRYSGNRDRMCGVCRYFVELGACEIVAGLIRPVDVCDKFEPRRGDHARGAQHAARGREVWSDAARRAAIAARRAKAGGRPRGDGATRPPEAWLMGRTQAHERTGLSPRDALHQAVLDWQDQERMARGRREAGGLVEFDPSQARDLGGRFSGTGGKAPFRARPPAGVERGPGVVVQGAKPTAKAGRKPGLVSRLRQQYRTLRRQLTTPPPEVMDAEQGVPSYPTSGGVNLGALGPVVPSLAVPAGGMRAGEGRMRTAHARLVEGHRRPVCRQAECFRRHIEVTPPGFEPVVKALKRRPGVQSPWAVAWAMKRAGVVPKDAEAGAAPHAVTFGGGKSVRFARHGEVAPPGWEGTVQHMKDHPDITSPHALAWWMKGQGFVPRRGPRGGARAAEVRHVRAVMAEAVR